MLSDALHSAHPYSCLNLLIKEVLFCRAVGMTEKNRVHLNGSMLFQVNRVHLNGSMLFQVNRVHLNESMHV